MLGIVITAYNRAQPLKELLDSLNKVRQILGTEIPLVISIDNNGTLDVNKVAIDFEWKYGPKEVIIHKEKLGLVKHFIWAGDQTVKFDHVIFLEDDLIVSPEILNYSKQLIDFYEDDDSVAGASFYNPILNELTGTKFYQLEDGYDNFFMQQPYWGNLWFKNKWQKFKKYLETYELKSDLLPQGIAQWECSFKKLFVQYLVDTNRYIVTARTSIATNIGCRGLHNVEALYMYQVNLLLTQDTFHFCHISESLSVYGAFFEISPSVIKKLNKTLEEYDFEMDLNGLRTNYIKEYVITTKSSINPIMHFSSKMKPTELGVLLGLKGDMGVVLTRPCDIQESSKYYSLRQWLDINKNYHLQLTFPMLKMIALKSLKGLQHVIKYRLLKKK